MKHIPKSNCANYTDVAHQRRTIFGSGDVEKVQAVVARSACPNQNAESTPCSDHFWKLTCRKSARCCGTKHISKSKVQKTEGYGALLDVQMLFCVAGAGIPHLAKSEKNVRVL